MERRIRSDSPIRREGHPTRFSHSYMVALVMMVMMSNIPISLPTGNFQLFVRRYRNRVKT
jgi:hypothetical protein